MSEPTILHRFYLCPPCQARRLHEQVIQPDSTFELICLTCGEVNHTGKLWNPHNRTRSIE